MKILGHRGYWSDKESQNTLVSFKDALVSGFGIETDVRDLNGQLVISHDPPKYNCEHVSLDEFISLYNRYKSSEVVAFNIKSDGLQSRLEDILYKSEFSNYFVFDASIPDSLQYVKSGVTYYARQSEYEKIPNLYDFASGIWLDSFNSTWYNVDVITTHLENKKNVCVVSPELHGRNHLSTWKLLKQISYKTGCLSLCTDYPRQAKAFFGEKN